MTSCPQKSNFDNIITRDDLIEYIKGKCVFKVIETDQSCNIIRKEIS